MALFLWPAAYAYIWGGKPQIKNFDEIADDYEIIARLVIDRYSEMKPYDSYPENEAIAVRINEDNIECNNYRIPLTEEQKKAASTVRKRFYSISVHEDAVFFFADERGYYGLVYSKNPLAALYKAEFPQQGREYHRINSRWYEWGVWGI